MGAPQNSQCSRDFQILAENNDNRKSSMKKLKENIPLEEKDHLLVFFVYQSPVKAYGKSFQNAQIWHIVIAKRGVQ